MRRALLIGSLLIAALAYALYEPVPSYVLDRAFLTIGLALFRFMDHLEAVTERLGLADAHVLRRSFFDLVLPTVKNSSGVSFTYRQIADSHTLVAAPDTPSGAAVVYLHGGGWVFGKPEGYWELFAELAKKTGVTVFGVRYRLAPEHKFPAAFDDCLAATEAIFANAAELGIDASRIAIVGDSVGGQLTASVVQQLHRSSSQLKPKLQILIYPVTQAVNLFTESYRTRANEPILKPEQMAAFISQYLTGSKASAPWFGQNGHVTPEVKAVYEKLTGDVIPDVDVKADKADKSFDNSAAMATDFRVSPLLGNDLEKLALPRTHILACEFDPLFSEAVLYATRLQKSGVRAVLRIFRTYHAAGTIPKDGELLRNYLVQVINAEL